MSKANVAILISGFLILVATFSAIILARGYLPDFSNRTLQPTGILVSTSDPDGARVYINNKLTTATNNTINLNPGSFNIKIEKDGYTPWEKTVEIKKEEVIKTNAFLFPKAPDLRPLTLSGAINPTTSQDQHKVVYAVASSSAENNGIWIFDMGSGRPIIGGGNSRQVYRFNSVELGNAAKMKFIWGPDDQQIVVFQEKDKTLTAGQKMATPSGNIYQDILLSHQVVFPVLLISDTSKFTATLDALTGASFNNLLDTWSANENERLQLTLAKLNGLLSDFLRVTSSQIHVSPDGTKVLYVASTSATLQPILSAYLPGTNPTPQVRQVTPGSIYVYDVLEDKNYFIIDNNKSKDIIIHWFPSSKHLLSWTSQEISVREFDGTNLSVLYTGPFAANFVEAFPDWSKIIVLTSLNSSFGNQNLYSINLR